MPTDRATLYTIARTVRFFLEAVWIDDNRGRIETRYVMLPPSAGACSYTASLLTGILRENHHPKWNLASGGYSFGSFYRAHCWNVNAELNLLIDLTADQFNDAAIVIAEMTDPRYQISISNYRSELDNVYQKRWEEFRRTRMIPW